MSDQTTARQKITNLLWWSIPSHDTAEAKATAEQMLDDHAAEVRRQRSDLEAATEFRLTPAPPAYTPLIVRRDPAYDGTRWAVLHDPGDIAVRRTWTAEGWEMAWASTDDEIFCWPDAETALVQARRAQGDDDNEPGLDGAGRTYESYYPRAAEVSAETAAPAPPVAPLAASQPSEAPVEPGTPTSPPTPLLDRTEHYLSVLHTHQARHDTLAAGYGCAGCELRDAIRAQQAAATDGQPQPAV